MQPRSRRRAAFRALHERAGAFIIPNPWDPRAALGFEALATTGRALANFFGRAVGNVSGAEVIANSREIVEATDLPVNCGLESCLAHQPAAAAEAIRHAAEADSDS